MKDGIIYLVCLRPREAVLTIPNQVSIWGGNMLGYYFVHTSSVLRSEQFSEGIPQGNIHGNVQSCDTFRPITHEQKNLMDYTGNCDHV